MKKRTKTTRKIVTHRKRPSLITRFKRIILMLAGMLFVIGLLLAYSNVEPLVDSRTGKVAVWTGGLVASPLVQAIPWWVWGGLASIVLYLWYQHKLIMSILIGLVCGIMLALL
jgi:hypothetical protein